MTRTNKQRADEALELCAAMQELTGVDDLYSQVSDIMCHLMHLCRLHPDEDGDRMDFEGSLNLARINFQAECEEDPDDNPIP